MRQFYIILSFILSLPLFASAQLHYPIRTTTIVTPPVPYTLDGFVSQPGRLMLHIMVDDITLSQYPVKLRLHIEGNGIRITTNPNIPQQPVYLNGGVVTQLTGPDLELFFNPSNLLFQGYSQSEYNRNGRLPEGVYRIRFEVLDYYRNFQVSSAIPAVAMLSLTGAPVLTFPANRSEVDIDMTPVLRFSWMAVFSAIPDALISYRFRLWQVRPDSRDPYEIVRVTSPLYETTTHETALLYDGSMPPLTRGSRYVWQVTAVDEAGKVLFKNNGDSDIFTLRYGKQCAAPSAVITKVTHNSVAVSWNSAPSVREYAVRYKKENATGWQEVTTRQAGITIEGLDHSALYELTVTGNCGTETSENERVLRFKTDRFVDYSCGASAPGISLENREPLPALHRFDEFMAADFYVEVTEVSGSNGVFTGRGIASVPYLNFLQFEVVFNGITINSDHRMIDGKVVFVYDEATGMIIGGDMGRGDDPSESGPEAYNHQEALEYIAGQVITLDEDVQTVTIDNKGQVTVVTESGQKKSYLVGENQTLAIITPQSTTIVDQASGQTFHLPNTSPGSSSDVRSRAQSKLYGCEVSFRPSANSRFGFDVVGNGSVKPNSYFKRDRGGNAVPWKSLETGNSDLVTMLSTGDCPPDSLRLIRESGILTPTKPGSNNTLELLLTGGFEGQEELLTVARATLLHINDTTGSEILTEAGALGVVSYRRSTQNVVLVPVNSAGFPTQGTDRSVIIRRLNEIYGAAVVSWNVHIDNAIEVGRIKEEDFKVEGTALLSKYTTDMNRVIRAYKRDRVTDDNTMYLFFMEIPNMGSNRKGFMPLAGNYGFIFNFEARDLELIAHELAHGAFNLRHTFSENATHYFPQNQTANLMDYAGGTELWKYQWDLIHNPEKILFSWAQEEEEGAAISMDLILRESSTQNIEFDIEGMITCLTPAGKPYTLPSNVQMLDFTSNSDDQPDGALFAFATDDNRVFSAAFRRSTKEFLGYAEIKRQSNNILDRIDYKDSEKKIPVLREDNLTKSLSDDSRVLIGKVINCAINVYQIEYIQVINKEGVQEDEYYGSGSFDNPISYNLQGKTPISVSDPTACFNAHAKKFYKGHISASSAYKDVLLRIANLINSVEEQGDNVFSDYERYCRAERSERYYGSPETWVPEYYELFANALEAYIESKDALEKIILAETNRDRVTDLAWSLVSKWAESISYDVRLHIIKKLSEGKMYGNPLFGNGQEYLAVRLISGIQNVEEQAKFLTDITKDDLLEVLFSRMGDELGGDNFSTFIMLLSQMAKNNIETFGVQGDPLFIWVGNLFRSDKVKIDFTTGSQLKVQGFTKEFTCYPTYYGGGTSCTSKWDTTTPEYTLSPFTFIPVKFPKGEKFLESLSDDGSNIAFVPVIYLKALNAKRNTDVTKTTVGIAVDVASLCIGIGELNAAIKAVKISKDAIKILRLTAMATDVVITSSDIIITLVEDDIRELEGGPEFLDKYRTYSALSGLTAFGGDVLTKSPETLAGLSDSWHKFKGTHGSNPKKVINAVGGTKGYHDIEKIVDETEDALRQTQHVLPPSSSLDVNAKYADAIAHIADDWRINALGRPISDLKEAPLGYYFYPKKNPEGLRRLDANDPKTPQLKVENGLVVVANKYADNLTGVAKGTHQTLVSAGVRHIDDGTTIKYLTKEGEEFAKIDGDAISLTTSDGKWPKVEDYLSKTYIDNHLAQFNNGASYLVPKDILDKFGRDILGWPDNAQFVMPKIQMDNLLKKANGNIDNICTELGINPNDWRGRELVRIDIPDVKDLHLRMAVGNEQGANALWLPGGKLPTGYPEAVIDNIPSGKFIENEL